MSKFVDTHTKKHQQRGLQNKKSMFNKKKGITFAKADECYGKVIKVFGNSQFKVKLTDSTEVNGDLTGSMKRAKKCDWVSVDDIVLLQVGNPNLKGKKYYEIIHKYSREDTLELERLGHLVFKENNKEVKKEEASFKFTLEDEDDKAPIDIMGI